MITIEKILVEEELLYIWTELDTMTNTDAGERGSIKRKKIKRTEEEEIQDTKVESIQSERDHQTRVHKIVVVIGSF